MLDGRAGFRRGFGTYEENKGIFEGAGNAPETFGAAVDWASTHRAQPFFLFVHTYAVHEPYEPPQAYQSLFVAKEAGKDERTPAAIRYAQEARALDDQLSILTDGLSAIVARDRLFLIVTADHGEEFNEHGSTLHRQLYDEVMHVPLVFRWPGVVPAGRRIDSLVSLIDIVPTILDLLHLPAIHGIDGLSLAPLLGETPGRLDRSVVFAEYPGSPATRFDQQQFVARSGEAKCVVPADGGSGHCFDLRADPGERQPLDGDASPATASLYALAEEYRHRELPAGGAEPATAQPSGADVQSPDDERIEEKLRALGYLD
jgi:arylsulfatase A-like enzyme